MSIQPIKISTNIIVAKAKGALAKSICGSKDVAEARFMINPLYTAENPQMMSSPFSFVQEIKRGIDVMKAAEADGRYRDISNEIL